jgi:hypothetical protein
MSEDLKAVEKPTYLISVSNSEIYVSGPYGQVKASPYEAELLRDWLIFYLDRIRAGNG